MSRYMLTEDALKALVPEDDSYGKKPKLMDNSCEMMELEGAAGGEWPLYDTISSIDDIDRRLVNFLENKPAVHELSTKKTIDTPVRFNTEMRVPKYEKISNVNLPSYQAKDDILKAIKENKITIVCGETGSGKSTQIPQYVLNDCAKRNVRANIICTQPRRLAAMSLASRVASERNSELGNTVGYKIRNKAEVSQHTNLVFMTSGYLLSLITNNDEFLSKITHCFIDEIHERDVNADFLLRILKAKISVSNLKIILMSATIQSEIFSNYFEDSVTLQIPGRIHEVKEIYLDQIKEAVNERNMESQSYDASSYDKDYMQSLPLIASLVKKLHSEKPKQEGILIFQPGVHPIKLLKAKIEECIRTTDYRIFIVHSQIDNIHSSNVFKRLQSSVRKIVLATNVAETSITIEDMVHVIDSGLVKVFRYNAISNAQHVSIEFVSKASANQRKGRVGRTRDGICYRMYSKEDYAAMIDHPEPEITRMPLTQICLRTKSVSGETSILHFLRDVIEPPPDENVNTGIATLVQIGALDSFETLTGFGHIALHFPIDVRLVKALILSIILRCLEPVMQVAAMLSVKPPFFMGVGDEKREIGKKKMEFASEAAHSDFRFLHNVYNSVYGLDSNVYFKYDFCKRNFISYSTMQEAKETIESIKRHFAHLDFLHTKSGRSYSEVNVNQDCWEIINACFVAAYFPNTSYIDNKNGQYYMETFRMETIVPDYASILSRTPKTQPSVLTACHKNWLVYKDKTLMGRGLTVRFNVANIVSPMTLLLFAGRELKVEATTNGTVIKIDGIIQYKTDGIMLDLIQKTRKWISERYGEIISHPQTYGMKHEQGRQLKAVFGNVLKLIERENTGDV